MSHCVPPGQVRPGSVGVATPNTEWKIADPDSGAALPVGDEGEVWVRGPQVLLRMQADYITAKGEVRTVHLADGSKVELDSASAIRLDYDGVQRRISLLQGSAIFDVAPRVGQETRPFVVQSAGGQTRALGTRFVVAREAEAIMVRVEPKVVPVPLTTYNTAPQLTWRRVVCEKEASPSLIRNLQAALLKEGFDAGPTDAKLGKKTMAAVESYQTQMGVASGILTYETLKLLGLEPLAGSQP